MKQKYLFKILLFVLLLISLDYVIGKILAKYYNSMNRGEEQKVRYSLNDVNEDVVIFGASRAQHHYSSSIISDSLNVTVFNTGYGGINIL